MYYYTVDDEQQCTASNLNADKWRSIKKKTILAALARLCAACEPCNFMHRFLLCCYCCFNSDALNRVSCHLLIDFVDIFNYRLVHAKEKAREKGFLI